MRVLGGLLGLLCFLGALAAEPPAPATIRIATWNVQNYLATDRVVEDRYRRTYPKPETEKAALRAVLAEVAPTVLALQEIGDGPYLLELQRDLAGEGVQYPHAVWLDGPDEDRHLAVLSKLPLIEVIEHTELDFKYFDGRLPVKRGLLEVVFEHGGARWHLFNLHLKSRYTDRSDDPQSALRREREARAIRDFLLTRLEDNADARFLVVGDFNDHRDSFALRRFLQINDQPILTMLPAADDRGDRWTHHYVRQDSYDRVDFILATPAARSGIAGGVAVIPDSPAMLIASDHRLLFCDLEAPRRP